MLGLCVPSKSTSRFVSLWQSSVGCVQHWVYLWQCAHGKAPDHDLKLSLRLSSTLLQKMSDSCTVLAGCDEPPRTDACWHNTDSEALRWVFLKSDAQTESKTCLRSNSNSLGSSEAAGEVTDLLPGHPSPTALHEEDCWGLSNVFTISPPSWILSPKTMGSSENDKTKLNPHGNQAYSPTHAKLPTWCGPPKRYTGTEISIANTHPP